MHTYTNTYNHIYRWSTPDGQKFTEDLEQAGMQLPEGWSVSATWSIMSTQFDPDGWQYATALDSPFWHFENNSSLCKCMQTCMKHVHVWVIVC